MKPLLFAILATVVFVSSLSAQVIYSGEQNLSIGAVDLEGVYINFETGEIASAYPGDFEDGAWINFTLGGYGIFNGSGVRPIAAGDAPYDPLLSSDYYLNVSEGTLIDDVSAFVVDGFASENHVGIEGDSGKFVPGQPGILGFEFTKIADSSVHFGWVRFTVGEAGNDGVILDWAYENAPDTAIEAGAVPEPSAMAMLVTGVGFALCARRRTRRPGP